MKWYFDMKLSHVDISLGAVYMEAGLARLARQPGKRDLALLLFF